MSKSFVFQIQKTLIYGKFKAENNLTSKQLMMMCAASKTRNLSWMLDISMALERT
jgi:hypothetical protein